MVIWWIYKLFLRIINNSFFQQILEHIVLVEELSDNFKMDSKILFALDFIFHFLETFSRGIFCWFYIFSSEIVRSLIIKMLDIKFFGKMIPIYKFLIEIILICRDFRIVMKLRTVNEIVSINFAWKTEMAFSIFDNNIIDRNLIKFLNKNKIYNRSR